MNQVFEIACTAIQPYGLFVPRWMQLAMPEDVEQEIALAGLMGRTEAQRRDALKFRLRELRRTQWERRPVKPAKRPPSIRPGKLKAITGYRHNPAAHRTARLTVKETTRRAIARKGARARWNVVNSSNR